MGKIWLQLVKSGLLSVVALVVLEILIWFGGEYFGVLSTTRALIGLIVLFVWVVLFVLQRVLAARTARLMEQRLGADAQAHMETVAPGMRGEVEQLRRNLKEAIQTLKGSRLGGSALYAMPWYIIIGPPGSGKSTALLESGLTFPSVGGSRRSIRGVGGTRNCDWWFTDHGILLDTAGRYTTEAEDREEWLSFLDLLRKSRRHKPINGAIVAISIAELMGASDVEIEKHAENIRARLDELADRLQLVFPIYLLFTKCDLVSGFTSFFEDLGRSERAVVWGATFPFTGTAGKSMQARFEEEFANLYRGLIARRTGLLASERPMARKTGIFQFPVQLALAENRLSHFVGSLFRPNPYQESCILRGFYFTSGTQEGAPVDQIMAALSRAFGLGNGPAEAAEPMLEKKSYFLNHLFTKVIFPDQGLARSSARAEKNRHLLRVCGLIGLPAAALVMVTLLLISFFTDHALIGRVDQVVASLKSKPRSGPLTESLEPIDTLRREIVQVEQRPAGGSMGLRWGKQTSGDLADSLKRAWLDRAVRPLVVPVIDGLRAEVTELATTAKDLDDARCSRLADLVQADEMLASKRDRDDELLGRVLLDQNLWPAEAKGVAPQVADQLRFFLATWKPAAGAAPLAGPWGEIDKRRCETARQKLLNDWPIAMYEDAMRRQAAELGDIDRDALAGSHLVLGHAFSRAFTPAEWSGRIRALLRSTAQLLAARMKRADVPLDEPRVFDVLVERYRNQHREHWLRLLGSVTLKDDGRLRDMPKRCADLLGKESQLLALFAEVRQQQMLDMTAESKPAHVPTEDLAVLRGVLEQLPPLHGDLRAILATQEAPLLAALADGQLARLATQLTGSFDRVFEMSTGKPYADAQRRVLEALLLQVKARLRETARSEADAHWQKEVAAPFAALRGLFPFTTGADKDVPLKDVSAFVGGKSGTMWAAEARIAQLCAIRINREPLATLSADCTAFLARMKAIREALYNTKDREDLAVFPFGVNMGATEATSDVRFQICTNQPEISRKELAKQLKGLTQPQRVEWRQGDCCLGTTMSIEVAAAPWRKNTVFHARGENPKSEWGLFHLVRSGVVPRNEAPERGFYCDLEFKVPGEFEPVTLTARLVITVDDYTTSPFHPGFFADITCPPGACQ